MESTGMKLTQDDALNAKGWALRGLPVIGLDISLTSTGISNGVATDAIQAGPLRGEERMDYILNEITPWVGPGVRLAVIEGPSFNSLGPGHDELAGLRWMVRQFFWQCDIPIAVVPPASLKKYTTGRGNATKEEMVNAVVGRWGFDFSDVRVGRGRHDMTDAFALARMGEDFVDGKPYDAVQWPDVTL